MREASPKTTRVLLYLVLGAAALQWTPGLEALRWMPDDALALVPKVLRPGAAEEQVDPSLSEEIDDEVLLAMGPPPALPIAAAELAEASAEAPVADVPEDALGPEITSQLELPPEPEVRENAHGLPLLAIEDPQGVMKRFYRSLTRVQREQPGAITRVLHYGDSLVTGDYVTQTVRRLMQKKFGDAGHGFVLAGRPAPWYNRDNLRLSTSKSWDVYRLTKPTVRDGMYGLGGATFRTRKRGQYVRVEPTGEAPLGHSVSKFQAFYLAQRGGGVFRMGVDGRTVKIDTRAETNGSRLAEIQVRDGHHSFELRTLGRGEVRLFGVVLERPGPGVVYDSLGVDGARARLLRRMKPEHWHDQIRLRRPDLLVLHYGTNESQWGDNLPAQRYRHDLTQIVGHLRAALPGVSCLIVGPLDRAHRHKGKLVTRPVVKRIVKIQRAVAYTQGCAFWNTWRAMGGEGSMARWYRAKPPLGGGDLTHPTRLGAERVGKMFFAALMEGYRAHLEPDR